MRLKPGRLLGSTGPFLSIILACFTVGLAKQPRRPPPQKRKSDLPAGDAVASRAIVPRPRDSPQGRHLRSAAAGVHPAAARELVT
jgi:hypothetical protein